MSNDCKAVKEAREALNRELQIQQKRRDKGWEKRISKVVGKCYEVYPFFGNQKAYMFVFQEHPRWKKHLQCETIRVSKNSLNYSPTSSYSLTSFEKMSKREITREKYDDIKRDVQLALGKFN